jgi:hypothetical protein
VTPATIVAIAAAAVAVLAAAGCAYLLRRLRAHTLLLDQEVERGKAEFDAVVAREVEQRSEELARTLARTRADAMSQLAEEERRIAEERRRDVAERERDASARLNDRIIEVQRDVELRLAGWAGDVEKLQEGLVDELKRVETRQRQLMADVEARIGRDAEGLQAEIDEQKQLIGRLRGELNASAAQVTAQAQAELEQHAHERRQALHDIAERLRKRERDLQELIEREGAEAATRIQSALADIERRQVEQLQRAVHREATRHTEAAAVQFDTALRGQREEAARRLSRELDLAVERFAREAEGVLAERLDRVTDAAGQRIEERLARMRSALDRQRDEALRSLEHRAHQVEARLRERLNEIAADAESERSVLEARLHDLQQRLDELTARA